MSSQGETDDRFVPDTGAAFITPAAEAYRLRHSRLALRADIAGLRIAADDARAEVARFQNSSSWLLTAPARWVLRNLRQLCGIGPARR